MKPAGPVWIHISVTEQERGEAASAKTSLRGADVVFFNLISPPRFLLLLLQAARLFYALCVKLKTSGEERSLGVTALFGNDDE